MSGERTAQIVALWQSGELVRLIRSTGTLDEAGQQIGCSGKALKHAIDRARAKGYAIPPYAALKASQPQVVAPDPQRLQVAPDDEWIEEPTHPHLARADIGKPDISPQPIAPPQQQPIASRWGTTGSQFANPEPSRWPHLEAFDAVGGNDMLPAHGPGVRRSTLLRDGEPVLQWIKNPGSGEQDALLEAIKRLGDEMPKADPVAPPEYADEDLLCVYPLGDPHLGLLSWAPEAGENFNTTIAEQRLFAAADRLVSRAPNARRALVLNLGDYFHADGPGNTTTAGTKVDVDGRWAKVLAAGIRTMRRIIDRALEKHEHVTVINEIGNHDTNSSVMLSLALAQFYEREPRVTIDTSPESFHWYRFGACLIGSHHGHRVKFGDLGAVMACDRAQDWGETRHRRMYVGHVHHDTVKELRGVTVESMRTLAPSDAWHRGQGYRSGRDMKMDVWHARRGIVERHIVSIDELQEAA